MTVRLLVCAAVPVVFAIAWAAMRIDLARGERDLARRRQRTREAEKKLAEFDRQGKGVT